MNNTDKTFIVRALQACVENSDNIIKGDFTKHDCYTARDLAEIASADTKARLQTVLNILKECHWFK